MRQGQLQLIDTTMAEARAVDKCGIVYDPGTYTIALGIGEYREKYQLQASCIFVLTRRVKSLNLNQVDLLEREQLAQ
jgi:hypothetical protein